MILKNSKRLKKISFILLILSFLSSCGSDGGTTNPPPVDTSSSDWGSMVWDQDDWG